MKDTKKKMEGREQATRTLRELGVPGSLAAELESAFLALGKTEGNRITGFSFVTPEGERHALRLEETADEQAPGRAA
jgi:hypothetical protein